MEKLADSGLLAGAIDVSTTEIADEIVRRRALGRARRGSTCSCATPLPYVGSCGALDMVNFGAWDTVPERFKRRKLYRHNPNVTLMRTTRRRMPRDRRDSSPTSSIAMTGPVRFLIPEGGVSSIDGRASRSTIPPPTGRCSRRSSSAFAPAPTGSSSACR